MTIPENDSTSTEVPFSPMRQPHQQRVIEEKEALDGNIERLDAFSISVKFESLDEKEQERMLRQLNIMQDYSAVLGERIAAFPPAKLTIVP